MVHAACCHLALIFDIYMLLLLLLLFCFCQFIFFSFFFLHLIWYQYIRQNSRRCPSLCGWCLCTCMFCVLCGGWFCWLIWDKVCMYERRFETLQTSFHTWIQTLSQISPHLHWQGLFLTEFDHPKVTLHGWQDVKIHRCLAKPSCLVQFSSVQDGIYALRKACIRFTPSLRRFPNIAFKTVPVFVWLMIALSRPFKEDRQVLPLSTPCLVNN